jgi:hypothetical protein
MKKLIALLVLVITFTSCTENYKTRMLGGTDTVQLESGKRLVNITWKSNSNISSDLWILTKQDTTKPSTYLFEEKSSFGIMEGKVIVIEK